MLYGTTQYGGDRGLGTVFTVTASGKERVIHSFGSGSDGIYPMASLLYDRGVLYGTTYSGGTGTVCKPYCGTVFKMTPSGAESVLYNFLGGSDAADPIGE